MEQDHPFIVGGDFTIILHHVLVGQGGNSKRKDSVEHMSVIAVIAVHLQRSEVRTGTKNCHINGEW